MGTGLEQMLAVVEHDQALTRDQMIHHGLFERAVRLLDDAERLGQRFHHVTSLGQRRQIDEPGAVWESVRQTLGQLDGETRLAAAADAGHGERSMLVKQTRTFREILLAADEAGALAGQVMGRAFGTWSRDIGVAHGQRLGERCGVREAIAWRLGESLGHRGRHLHRSLTAQFAERRRRVAQMLAGERLRRPRKRR
jgi:hypothetical protein